MTLKIRTALTAVFTAAALTAALTGSAWARKAAAPIAPKAAAQETPNVAAAHYKIGAIDVYAIHDNHFSVPNDGKVFGLGADVEAVSATLRAAGAPTDKISVEFGGLLVKDGARVILIDTGGGASLKGGLIDSLKSVGVTPDAVTDVLITHSHFDHVGGLIDAQGASVFAKAAIRMTAKEWEFMQANPSEAPITTAIKAQIVAFEPGARISDHVTAVPVDGHTPGHTAYEIDGGAAKLLDVGDTVHSSIISLAHPEWGVQFDSDKPVAMQSRIALLTSLAKSHELVYAPHFPFPSIGRISAEKQGFAWRPAKPAK